MTIIRAADMRLSDGDLARVASRFGIRTLEELGGFENALYRSADPPGRVLRITHASRRSIGMIEGEVAFMQHLAAHSLRVVEPVSSVHQNLVEALDTDDGEPILAACMTEAQGAYKQSSQWNEAEIESYGALLGGMHAAAESFEPLPRARRPSWQDPIFDVGLSSVRDTEPQLLQRQQEIVSAAAAHWSGASGMLIHQDAHLGNLLVTDQGKITIFDFDDCAYGTPTHDVAIVLFYWLLGLAGDPGEELSRFIRPFLTGYSRYASLPHDWPDGADLFLSFREIDIYWLCSSIPGIELSSAESQFMVDRRRRIFEGVPYLGAPLSDFI